jgi:hypothetical protein
VLVHKYSGLTGWQAHAAAVGVALAIGLAKEATDVHFNGDDILGYGAGAMLGNLVVWKF